MSKTGVTILIVDDEPPARQKVRSFLKEEAGIASVEEAENGVDAAKRIKELEPDIVFLDIQMPGMTGFEVIEAVGVGQMPVVVFVTAYDQHAIEAFEVQAVDYLLKPFHQQRFKKSFQRAMNQVRTGNAPADEVKQLLEHLGKDKPFPERIMVKKGSRYFFVKTAEIVYIEAEEKYVKLHTPDGSYLVRDTMTRMEERLDPAMFARIHRSYIVGIDSIKEIQPWSHGDYVVILQNGEKLTLSRRYSDRLLRKF